MIPDQLLRLAINRLSVLRAREKRQLEEIVDTESLFTALTPELISQIVGRRISRMDASGSDLLRRAEDDLRALQARRCFFLAQTDARYPAQLREIYDAPYLLFVRGRLPQDGMPSIAIVGTRTPTATAVLAAEELAAGFVESGIAVISGLARGIDAAAHRGALDPVSGVIAGLEPRAQSHEGRAVPTGAVLASGVDLITPASNRSLAGEILDRGGFLASEYSPGVAPQKYHFPARNRIISGLARGVVVVQAPIRSGALITADYALDQGRDLFVHARGLDGAAGAGTADLASDGAPVVSQAADVLLDWGVTPVARETTPSRDRTLLGVGGAASSGEAAEGRVAVMRAMLGDVIAASSPDPRLPDGGEVLRER